MTHRAPGSITASRIALSPTGSSSRCSSNQPRSSVVVIQNTPAARQTANSNPASTASRRKRNRTRRNKPSTAGGNARRSNGSDGADMSNFFPFARSRFRISRSRTSTEVYSATLFQKRPPRGIRCSLQQSESETGQKTFNPALQRLKPEADFFDYPRIRRHLAVCFEV